MSKSQVPDTPPGTRRPGGPRVCPACRRPAPAGQLDPALVPRCAEHGLAYVDEAELPDTGNDAFLGKTLVDRFVVLGRLGAGSMGAVYRARQEAVGRDVALKIVRRDRVYDPETKTRFEREARAMSSLTSAHTVTVFDFGEADDGSWFLAMEMLKGESLGARLRREGALPWRSAVRFAREALLSLAEAHGKGIVHRDLKPDNLFLWQRSVRTGPAPQEMCKVLDFGIAKFQHDGHKLDQLETQAGTVFGTPRYMSPEQAQGNELDGRSDLYSLGVILFQMLSGRPPFVADDAVVVMAKHIKDPPPSLASVAPGSDVPELLEQVVLHALAKNPEQRIQTAEAFIADLDRAVRSVGHEALDQQQFATTTAALAPVARPSPPSGRVRSRKLAIGSAFAGLALVGGSLGLMRVWSPKAGPEIEAYGTGATLRAPATMPHRTTMTAKSTNSEVSMPTSPASATPVASVSATPPGPPTQVPPRLRTEKPRSSEPLLRKAMEPKRPDERYGRFR